MMSNHGQRNLVRVERQRRGWSQQELAIRTGLSRAGVSAIESGRLVPSVRAALALARALEASVEQLFESAARPAALEWAAPPAGPSPRFWNARVGERTLSYPIGEDTLQLDWHDAVFRGGSSPMVDAEKAERTLVVASCDPAAALLAGEFQRQFQFRMLVLRRNSMDALNLLAIGMAHVAGIHLGHAKSRAGNARAARHRLGKNCQLLRVATWEEGLAISPRVKDRSIRGLASIAERWVGREEGSGARQCQDKVLGNAGAPKRVASDHRMVAAALKCGWGDVGPCVRLASEEAGLDFLPLYQKTYDLCFRGDAAADPRISALVATIRSRRFRTKLSELPGYRAHQTGDEISITP